MTVGFTTELKSQWCEAVNRSGVTGVPHDLASAGIVGARGLGRVARPEDVVRVSNMRYVGSHRHNKAEDVKEAIGRELKRA